VVYGASGYTGRLVCEYLREYNIPFIAAGRSADKLRAALQSNVAGIETASYDVVEVKHTTEALTQLFKGASVVLNTVGPFAKFGHEVVQACLTAKCHYTDTTGEQDWLITLDQEYGGRFAAAGLLLSPGLAQMYTTGEIAAQLCLETPGLTLWTSRCSGAAARRSHRRRRFWSMRPWPRPTTSSRTSTSSINPMPACGQPDDPPANTRPRSHCPGAGRRIRCGSSATRAWPTSKCSAACSTSR
jgi:hypothetical protein